jgi:hypothetical protein
MLRKTTILPTDSRAQAEKMFRDLIHQEAVVLFVAFGATAEATQTVSRADKLAGLEGEPRWVVWARNPELVSAVIAELDVPEKLKSKLSNAKALALNFDDKVCDVIAADEDAPTMTRILKSYAKAEAD